MQQHKYQLIVYWSGEDDAFVVDVPELPCCMAHGASQNEAVANTQDAIVLWLDTARETRREIPEPKARRLPFA